MRKYTAVVDGDLADLLGEAEKVLDMVEAVYRFRSGQRDINKLDIDGVRSGRVRALRGEVAKLKRAEIAKTVTGMELDAALTLAS